MIRKSQMNFREMYSQPKPPAVLCLPAKTACMPDGVIDVTAAASCCVTNSRPSERRIIPKHRRSFCVGGGNLCIICSGKRSWLASFRHTGSRKFLSCASIEMVWFISRGSSECNTRMCKPNRVFKADTTRSKSADGQVPPAIRKWM